VEEYVTALSRRLESTTTTTMVGDQQALGITECPTPPPPAFHELQAYMAAARVAYDVIMNLREKGKVNGESLSRLM